MLRKEYLFLESLKSRIGFLFIPELPKGATNVIAGTNQEQ
jgi:hypothetical protein